MVKDRADGSWADGTLTLLCNNEVLVAGGSDENRVYSSAEICDPSTGTWRRTGSMTDARFHHTATLLPDCTVLVTGGANLSGTLSSTEIYDPKTEAWFKGPQMPIGRTNQRASLLPNSLLLVTGGYFSNATNLPLKETDLPPLSSLPH